MLTVSDTGVGMSPETQAHLFEPFFTTKPEGRGTGLGLATVYGIVRQASGSISIESAPGAGTTVRIWLPRIAEPAEAAHAEPGVRAPVPGGTETVLLVEDDPAIRAYAARALGGLGYTVLEAASGTDALGLATAHAETIDLLVTDIVMPGMQGTELARRLAAIRPSLPVLYMSGFTDGALGAADLPADVSFLAKPFTIESFARAVRSALGATDATAAPVRAGS